jgi:hypothetical protein
VGYIKHEAVIATIWEGRNKAIEAWRDSLSERERGLVAGPLIAFANGDATYVIAPDGSKEGWADSNRGEELREQFIRLVKNAKGDYVHVAFGGDYGNEVGTTIIDTSDPAIRTPTPLA